MPRPESHRIDERAKRIFNSALLDSWVPREQHPDYRIDYTIEVFNDDNSTGLFWHVQLKGTKAPRLLKSSSAISYPMEVEHLEYYLDKVPLPVFLVLVDTTKEEGWWVFLQHFIKTKLKDDWRTKSTATIRLPTANSISDSAALRSAISDATEYMRDLHPSSIAASIGAEKNCLESLDPRFEIDISATLDGTKCFLTPKEDGVSFTLHFKGERAVAKAKELVEAGGKVGFANGEARISGMVEGWRDDNELYAIETSRKAPAMIRFSALDEVKNERVCLDVNGEFAGGSKRGKFVCELSGGLITVCLPIDSEKTQTPIDIQFDFSKWVGLDVRSLPHLDAISPFFEIIGRDTFVDGREFIELEVFVWGNRMLDSKGDVVLAARFQLCSPVIAALHKAREVAKELGVEAVVPAEMGPQHIHDIEVVHGLLKNGVHSFPTPRATCSCVMGKAAYDKHMSTMKVRGEQMSTFQGGGLPFLTTAVDIGFQNVAISSMTFYESQTVEGDDSSCQIVFVAEDDCICTLRQCTETEVEMLKDYQAREQVN